MSPRQVEQGFSKILFITFCMEIKMNKFNVRVTMLSDLKFEPKFLLPIDVINIFYRANFINKWGDYVEKWMYLWNIHVF